ncbi:MAG: biotin-dependent carboxyltransferase family protein [Fulvimonas sp.]|nr:biotin-dependent carboxyltransferase family protein [Fulvimonas sp.]
MSGGAPVVEVLRAGLLSSVQDRGRFGWRHLGIVQSGALDALALELGNRLVGNAPTAAAIEITLGPARFRFTGATRVALTGGLFAAKLDDRPFSSGWSIPVPAGAVLSLPAASAGMRGYLCVSGGVAVPRVLGSRSTDLAAGFGGWQGRALRDGDALPLGAPAWAAGIHAPAFGVRLPENACGSCPQTAEAEPLTVRVMPGPEYGALPRATRRRWWTQTWRLSADSNRMGYRLTGAELDRGGQASLPSHAVVPGTIQVPPDGRPIILMNDAQTTGGYPRIGVVIAADLWRLAQLRLKAPVRFVPVTVAAAWAACRAERHYLRRIEAALRLAGLPGEPHDDSNG